MKWSKKDEAKWAKKRMDKSTGHSINNEELTEDQAWEKLRKKLENDREMMAAFRRLKGK